MKIAFVAELLNLRGITLATYDYADHNEKILGNESLIFFNSSYDRHLHTSYDKTVARFKNVIPFSNHMELHGLLAQHKVDFVYRLSWGHDESVILQNKTCPWGIHAVFMHKWVFGDKYAYISEWLRDTCNLNCDWVPHIIKMPDINEDLRQELNIGRDKIVLGGLGGSTSFDIPFAPVAVIEALNIRPDLYFVFMNIKKFHEHERCVFLPGTFDVNHKTKFINTCDAMVHARQRGETFGLSVGEFSARNKRIITWSGSPERAHIHILGEKALLYRDDYDLLNILTHINRDNNTDYDCYSKRFSPEAVMPKFSKVFLDK